MDFIGFRGNFVFLFGYNAWLLVTELDNRSLILETAVVSRCDNFPHALKNSSVIFSSESFSTIRRTFLSNSKIFLLVSSIPAFIVQASSHCRAGPAVFPEGSGRLGAGQGLRQIRRGSIRVRSPRCLYQRFCCPSHSLYQSGKQGRGLESLNSS